MDTATSVIISAFGLVGLLITFAASTLRQLPDLVSAFREFRRSLRNGHRGVADDSEGD
ncbi:hypothetical protein AB0C93_11110 [Streptomyces sp. NPDC048518]|uniref:hypothetical protein n=1 Tax=Streptomyces sp. NPDC048518 TaxID=3155029 RepID=UPI0033D2D056